MSLMSAFITFWWFLSSSDRDTYELYREKRFIQYSLGLRFPSDCKDPFFRPSRRELDFLNQIDVSL